MKNFDETLKGLAAEDKNENSWAVGNLEFMKDLDEEKSNQLIHEIYCLVWKTPKWKEQIALIDNIFSKLNEDLQLSLFDYICLQFDSLQTDRKDKFYYLAKKCLSLLTLDDILNLKNIEIRDYLCQFIDPKKTKGWDDKLFLEFLCSCPPWTCQVFNNFFIEESVARPFLERKGLHSKNIEAIYKTFQNKSN